MEYIQGINPEQVCNLLQQDDKIMQFVRLLMLPCLPSQRTLLICYEFPGLKARHMLQDICALHQHGVLHGDIAPRNILVTNPEEILALSERPHFAFIDFAMSYIIEEEEEKSTHYDWSKFHPHIVYANEKELRALDLTFSCRMLHLARGVLREGMLRNFARYSMRKCDY